MALNRRADVVSPDRSDKMLGQNWAWSNRHIDVVRSEFFTAEIENQSIYIEKRGNRGKRRVFHTTGAPIVVMAALTHLPDFEEKILERYKWE